MRGASVHVEQSERFRSFNENLRPTTRLRNYFSRLQWCRLANGREANISQQQTASAAAYVCGAADAMQRRDVVDDSTLRVVQILSVVWRTVVTNGAWQAYMHSMVVCLFS